MIETYQNERQMTAKSLSDELAYMEQELSKIKENGAYKDYTALMRTYLATQKAFLKIVAEIEQDEPETDELLAFSAGA